jgi:hypothetical protein
MIIDYYISINSKKNYIILKKNMIMIMVTAKKYKIKLSIINNKIKSNLYNYF